MSHAQNGSTKQNPSPSTSLAAAKPCSPSTGPSSPAKCASAGPPKLAHGEIEAAGLEAAEDMSGSLKLWVSMSRGWSRAADAS
eukprot:1283643-Rhodomonas_salina.1